MVMTRIYLSPPDVGQLERELLLDAFDSNWIAPLGPHVDAFERELAAAVGVPYAVALSSGTSALHLGLAALGVGRGDEVLTSTLTFAATANAITYVGATPVFIDAARDTWTMDVDLLVILNDNEMSISRPVGALTNYLARLLSGRIYSSARRASPRSIALGLPSCRTASLKKTSYSTR